MGRKAKYSLELKIQLVEEYLNGKTPFSRIQYAYGVSSRSFRDWVNLYKSQGIDGLATKHTNKSYSSEFKIKVVDEYLSGKDSILGLCCKYNISSHEVVRRWVIKYNSHGKIKSSKTGGQIYMTKGRTTTFEERVEIVQYCIENNKDYVKTIDKYQVSYQQIYGWVQKYEQNGVDGLVDRRGRKKDENSMTELERLKAEQKLLKAENIRLQMENELLKKLEELERRRY